MKAGLLPFNSELGELGLLALSMKHELPFVQALIETYKSSNETSLTAKGWMFCTDDKWISNNPIESLYSLHKTVKEYGRHLKILLDHQDEFLPFINIHRKLQEIKKAYFKIPFIEPEIHLLKSGHGIMENPDFLINLTHFLEEVLNLHTLSKTLRSTLMQEVINTISISFDKAPEKARE